MTDSSVADSAVATADDGPVDQYKQPTMDFAGHLSAAIIADKSATTIVGPLNLHSSPASHCRINRTDIEVPCLFCCRPFTFAQDKDNYLAHLFLQHKFVIADVQQVAILDEYLLHWHAKFQG